MRLLLIRHGDPDYINDTLTEKGIREAEMLADRLAGENIDAIYVSPLGRAQKTAEATLRRLNRNGLTLDWLQEFTVPVRLPGVEKEKRIWDFLPSFIDRYPELYSEKDWQKVPFIRDSKVPERYKEVCEQFDLLLAQYGYVRKGSYYEAVQPNLKTLVFFCHLGLSGVLMSHLFHMSPVAILQSFAGTPTSVTEIRTEEREKGIALFRANRLGDVSHLYLRGEPPAFRSASYCEIYDGEGRH